MNFGIRVTGITVTILNIVYSVISGEKGFPLKVVLNNSTTRNEFNNYIRNMTYVLTSEQQLYLNISCLSRFPSWWIWEMEETMGKPRWVSKERIYLDKSTNTFASNLVIHLAHNRQPVDTNFSCSLEGRQSRKDLYNQNVACVEFNYNISSTEFVNLRVHDGIRFGDCHQRGIEYARSQCFTQNELTVNLHTLTGMCRTNNHFQRTDCQDLDSCENILGSSVRNHTCDESVTVINYKYKENSFEIKNALIPIVFYCEAPLFSINPSDGWSSYVALYPSFTKNSSNNFSYFGTVEQARHDESIKLYALPYGVKFEEPFQIKDLNKRTKFARNETVEFLCVAIKYLYMKGFRWKLDDNYETSAYDWSISNMNNLSDESTHIVRKRMTLNGSFSRITCDAPIWNSGKWKSVTMNVSLFSPSPPKSSINCEENATFWNCSCRYSGWPQPTVTWWNDSGPLQVNRKNLTGKSQEPLGFVHPHKEVWQEDIHISNSKYNSLVHCKVKNMQGEDQTTFKFPHEGKSNQLVLILVTCLVFTIILAATATFFVKRYRTKYMLSKQDINEFFQGRTNLKNKIESNPVENAGFVLPYDVDRYEISNGSFQIDSNSFLGSGASGFVCKGSITRDGIEVIVAVKRIKYFDNTNTKLLKGLMSEIKVLAYVGNHNHIISLIGANTAELKAGKLMAFVEFCEMGSLETVLQTIARSIEHITTDVTQINANLQDFSRWSTEIASGMEYMAFKKVVHADLATRNILLTSEKCVKISDFGSSRRLYEYKDYVKKHQEPLPWRWMAPESLRRLEFNEKTDVWAFGITLWEIYTLGDKPYHGLSYDLSFCELLQQGLRCGKPTYADNEMFEIMMSCWENDPSLRPSFSTLKLKLAQATNINVDC